MLRWTMAEAFATLQSCLKCGLNKKKLKLGGKLFEGCEIPVKSLKFGWLDEYCHYRNQISIL